jgi:regulator of protease activity HflC (stomatin/prohibitin superfamily)
MSEFLRIVLDALHSASPFRMVNQWEAGLYFVLGRHWRTLGPGLKIFLPYICDVVTLSLASRVERTPIQFVNLRDGRTLSYRASFLMRVIDPAKAYLTLEDWRETIVEIASGVLNETIAEVEPARFDPARGKRDRLREELAEAINEQTKNHGVEVVAMTFSEFGFVRVIHLVQDGTLLKR